MESGLSARAEQALQQLDQVLDICAVPIRRNLMLLVMLPPQLSGAKPRRNPGERVVLRA